ncbi:MAG: 50S ribosomal protein L33 [Patescibacteria group bacterium]
MAKKGAKKSKYSENLIKFQCQECKMFNYYSRKNKKLVERKLEYKKFCKHCRKHTLHKETKKK